MNRILVVIEHWHNQEPREDFWSYDTNLCACKSIDDAKAVVAKRKAEIMAIAKRVAGVQYEELHSPGDPEYIDGISFEWPGCCSPFDGLKYDVFTWRYQMLEVIGS